MVNAPQLNCHGIAENPRGLLARWRAFETARSSERLRANLSRAASCAQKSRIEVLRARVFCPAELIAIKRKYADGAAARRECIQQGLIVTEIEC
jgi:hypothetical protein